MRTLLAPLFVSLFSFLTIATPASAQSQVRFGYVKYDSILVSMPEYASAQKQMEELRKKYEQEALYNEQSFRRQYVEFLQGQKDFPQNILMKRQRDLQVAMERGLNFRHEADSLLKAAEEEMLFPIRQRLDKAIQEVGMEHGYEYIVDIDRQVYPFIHPLVGENANPFVCRKLMLQEAPVMPLAK